MQQPGVTSADWGCIVLLQALWINIRDLYIFLGDIAQLQWCALYSWGYGIPYTYVNRCLFLPSVVRGKVIRFLMLASFWLRACDSDLAGDLSLGSQVAASACCL